MLVPLQGAAAGCRCRVLLEGAAVRVACALWSGHAAAAGCRWCCCQSSVWALAGMLVPLQGEGAACQAGVCAFERACWCRCRLQAAVRVMCALWSGHAAAAGCCLRVLLSGWRVRSGAGMLVHCRGWYLMVYECISA